MHSAGSIISIILVGLALWAGFSFIASADNDDDNDEWRNHHHHIE